MIKFENISKKYGRELALDNINLDIDKGQVVGILGPNGSGKTTLLKLIQGYLKPTKGKVTVAGLEVGPESKDMISYLPDKPFIPVDYTLKEAKNLYVKFFDDFRPKKFDELIKFMDLDDEKRVGQLSKGMSEKFHLALILSRDSDIYIIDEPIAGVDLVARDMILKAIFSNIGKEKLLVITTHLIDEIESLFDHVVFLGKGRVVLEGNAEDLRNERNESVAETYRKIFGY